MVNHPNRKRKIAAASDHDHDADYAALLASVRAAFGANTSSFFSTDVPDLNEIYLSHLGAERAVHNCSACRRFIQSFGALVTISEEGHTASAMWHADAVPEFYRPAVSAMTKAISRANVTRPFLSSDPVWGTPRTGTWTHFAVLPPKMHKHPLLSAGQAMAAKREDFSTVARALADFTVPQIAEAIRVLETGHLQSSEKFIAPLNWLAELHAKRAAARDARTRANLLWRAIATAPDGFCHPRSAVTGTLMEDIAAGMSFSDVQARWNAKVHPLQYQRPQAPPSAGNLAEAEKIVEKMGIARSLERRFARLEDCEIAWRPLAKRPAQPNGNGVFSHLSPKSRSKAAIVLDAPAAVMTWSKFMSKVLPSAEAIEAMIDRNTRSFIALTTAEHADAPPILKWDRADRRNPVAWYCYSGGSQPSQWGMSMGWATITAVVPLPPMWGPEPKAHLGEGFVLTLASCVDSNTGAGNALFPECLMGELHAVRSTIEAYSRRAEFLGRADASACGLDVRSGKSMGYRLRVTAGGLKTEYQIDRWD